MTRVPWKELKWFFCLCFAFGEHLGKKHSWTEILLMVLRNNMGRGRGGGRGSQKLLVQAISVSRSHFKLDSVTRQRDKPSLCSISLE